MDNITPGSGEAENCSKVMCQFLGTLYHLAVFSLVGPR